MKTLLYNPIFINPLAYYVFPRLTKYLEQDLESTIEPANYIGTIEVKVIAYGDTTFKKTFTNTDEIDLSEFEDTWIRISLFTKAGSCVLGEWKIGNVGGLPITIKDALVGIWLADDNDNYSPSKNIIKNKIKNKGGDFELLNFSYKLNSGYGKYEIDFNTWNKSTKITKSDSFGFSFSSDSSYHLMFYYPEIMKVDIPSFTFKLEFNNANVYYVYIGEDGKIKTITYSLSGTYTVPKSNNSIYTGSGTAIGFTTNGSTGTITLIPSFQGALVTDGVDDLIVSQNTVPEMLGGSNEITVVSMIHQIVGVTNDPNYAFNNYIREGNNLVRNNVVNVGKTGIYGYTYKNTINSIINILGDKKDYQAIGDLKGISSKFSVQGRPDKGELSQVAWYWTFIANKALTTDEINQVIAYYNLDKYVKPDVYYDIKKQGLNNDTLDTDWYLKDFSGNGRDMQLYNFAKKLDSGIGKYETDFSDSNLWVNRSSNKFTSSKIEVIGVLQNQWVLFSLKAKELECPSFTVEVSNLKDFDDNYFLYQYFNERGTLERLKLSNGINVIPKSYVSTTTTEMGFRFYNILENNEDAIGLTIEQIPDYEGSLVFDGVDDYGQYVGDLGLKDYTVVANREYPELLVRSVPILSSNKNEDATPFIFEHCNNSYNTIPFSYGINNNLTSKLNGDKIVSYQSTYSYNGTAITKGNSTSTGNGLTFGRYGIAVLYCQLVLYSFMLFSYTLSEFLIERQLKRYKLGTLYLNTNKNI